MSSNDALLPKKESNWRNHYVNGTPFTIAMATFALVAAGAVVSGAVMLVSGSALEAQELLPPVSQSLHSKVYGAKHEGVGFANYVVGNAVAKFWKQHMNALPEDPFAGALGVAKKGTLAKSAQGALSADAGGADADSSGPDAAPQPRRRRNRRHARDVPTPSARADPSTADTGSTPGNR